MAVLADYPNIASWNTGIKQSFATSQATEGVGAMRHCDLAPMGALEETVKEWEPESKMVISIDSATRIPIKRGQMTFSLAEAGDNTDFQMSYDYEPKLAFLSFVVGPMLDKQLRKGFGGFLDDLEPAAQSQMSG